jgi:murein DD-endopeptidase MepM/ murein hydrolase activator NlpD
VTENVTPRGDEAKKAATTIAKSAAKGASVGGAHGAVIGAVKGAGVAVIKNKKTRNLILGFLALFVTLIVLIISAGVASVVSVFTTLAVGDEMRTNQVIANDGVADEKLVEAERLAREYSIPKELAIAILSGTENFEFTKMADHLNQEDPQRLRRDLRAGAVSTSTSELAIPETGIEAELAENVKELYVASMQAGGLSQRQATNIFAIALHWALGKDLDPEQEACFAEVTSGESEGLEVEGQSFTETQTRNMRVIIGLAKTMFQGDAEAAATIALIIASADSNFLNLANDGVQGPEDNLTTPLSDEEYVSLAYSQEISNDGAGSAHAALGILQLQATSGWGDVAESSWFVGDRENVIRRLMNPSFNVATFYMGLEQIDGWQRLAPGKAAAMALKASSKETKYREQVKLSEQLWNALAPKAMGIAVPVELGWTGKISDENNTIVSGRGCATTLLIDGEYAWPIELDDDGSPSGWLTYAYGWRIRPDGATQFHLGLDLTGKGVGSGVFAAAGGTVIRSHLFSPQCGEYIQISHEDGTMTGYLHLTERHVLVGETVSAGQLLGPMGGMQPGSCTFGAHLHFVAFDQNGASMDPELWLELRGMVIPPEKDLTRK